MVPTRYGIMWTGVTTTVLVSIYKKDGSVAITHRGVEMGQGVNTKVSDSVPLDRLHFPVSKYSKIGNRSSMTNSVYDL